MRLSFFDVTPLREGVVMTGHLPAPMTMHTDQEPEEQRMEEELLLRFVGCPRLGTIEETGIDSVAPLGLNRIQTPLGGIVITRLIEIPISVVPTMPLAPDVATEPSGGCADPLVDRPTSVRGHRRGAHAHSSPRQPHGC